MSWLRENWGWIAFTVGLFALVSAAPYFMFKLAGNPPDAAPADTNGPVRQDPGAVDDAFIAHVQAGRYADAYALMTSGYRATVPLRDFEHAVSRNAYLKGSELIGCGSITTYGDTVHVRRDCIMHSAAGTAYTELFYALEDGAWRMTGIEIGGTSALPGFAFLPPEELPAEAPAETGAAE